MKKFMAVLLALILITNCVLIYFAAENAKLMRELLSKDFSSEQVPANPEQNTAVVPDAPVSGNGSTVELIRVVDEKYLTPPNDWIFDFHIANTADCEIFIEALIITDNGGENQFFANKYERPELLEMMMGPEFETTPLLPGDIMHWNDAHPGEYLTDRTYQFVFRGSDGKEYTATFEYRLIMEFGEDIPGFSTDYSTDNGKDLYTLRHDAAFSAEVYDGVFWVPANTLGKSRYSNNNIYEMVSETPEVKQREIGTLYEALQLYQVGGFAASDDNVRIPENGYNWEHHKPGYFAVLTNSGCCATDSNWLNYILKDDYDEVGYIATSQRDGSGHIYNYIKDGGWYYIIDLTHYRTDWIATAVESGNMDDYYQSDFILGNIHRTKSIDKFVEYVQNTFGDPPGLMFKYTAENCLAIDSVHSGNKVSIVYENSPDVNIECIFDDPGDNLDYYLTDAPKNLPTWE